MAKDNLFLGMARGKIGDVVFTHVNGTQISRARNRAPKNPQTPLQLLQRVLLKTSSAAYSMMVDICDHSFQGIDGKTPNQSRFVRVNIEKFRRQLSQLINEGSPEDILISDEVNFSTKQSTMPALNAYIVSEGSIPPLIVGWSSTAFELLGVNNVPSGVSTMRYQDMVDSLGIQRGDQLTFIGCSIDDSTDTPYMNGFRFARVIMEPENGDMTTAFLSAGGEINSPNPRNEGTVNLTVTATANQPVSVKFGFPDFDNDETSNRAICAAAVIVSRLNGNTWMRSTQSLVTRESSALTPGHLNENHYLGFLGEAVASYLTAQNSSLYLNQAENF